MKTLKLTTLMGLLFVSFSYEVHAKGPTLQESITKNGSLICTQINENGFPLKSKNGPCSNHDFYQICETNDGQQIHIISDILRGVFTTAYAFGKIFNGSSTNYYDTFPFANSDLKNQDNAFDSISKIKFNTFDLFTRASEVITYMKSVSLYSYNSEEVVELSLNCIAGHQYEVFEFTYTK